MMKTPLLIAAGSLVLLLGTPLFTVVGQDISKDLVKPLNRMVDVRTVAFSPDGRLLAAGSGEPTDKGEVAVWDTKTLELVWKYEISNGVPSVAFSRDGKILAVGSFTENCYLLESDSGKLNATLAGHNAAARSVAFSPEGQTLATGSYDSTVRLWDYKAGKLLRTLEGHARAVYCVAFSPDGKTLASMSPGNDLRLWDMASSKLLQTWEGFDGGRSVAFDPKGRWLAASTRTGLKLRDLGDNKVWASFVDVHADWVAVHPSGKSLAVSANTNTVSIITPEYREATADEQKRIEALIALWDDDRIEVRDKASQDIQKFGMIAEALLTKALKESDNAEIRMRARETRTAIRAFVPTARLDAHRGQVLGGAFSPDGTMLATCAQDGVVILWDTSKYQIKAKLSWPLDGKR